MPIANDAHCPRRCPVEGDFPQPEKECLQPQCSVPFHPRSILSGHQPTHPSARPHGPSTAERVWTGPVLSSTGLERASNIHGSDWHSWTRPVSMFFQGYCFTGGGSSLGHVPSSRGDLGKAFQLLAVTDPATGLSARLDRSLPARWRALSQPCCGCNVLPCANWLCWESGPSLKACADKPVNK